jgi:hypothetical protein
MAYDSDTNTEGPAGSPNRRSSFRDRALLLFYVLLASIAMGGWLWFLGWMSWNIIAWATGDTH